MKELGTSLERTLCIFKNREPISLLLIPEENRTFTKKCFLVLLDRGYIDSLSREKASYRLTEIKDTDYFTISVEGIDYLERRKALWRRMWEDRIFRLAPIVISIMALAVAAVSLLQALHWIHLEK